MRFKALFQYGVWVPLVGAGLLLASGVEPGKGLLQLDVCWLQHRLLCDDLNHAGLDVLGHTQAPLAGSGGI